jgi:2-polyprenyl-6-methoxyphenol hydroxylase-like FAD-dependent oxidoreductase
MRDVRLVSEILFESSDWSPSAFRPYAEERRERMFRLRSCAALTTDLRINREPKTRARRSEFFQRIESDSLLAAPLLCAITGPQRAPAEAFAADNIDRILSLGGSAAV